MLAFIYYPGLWLQNIMKGLDIFRLFTVYAQIFQSQPLRKRLDEWKKEAVLVEE